MRPVAAKETSNEAHVDVKHDVPVNATDTAVSGGSHTDYTPQPGDVVEFSSLTGNREKGIVFTDNSGDKLVAYDYNWHCVRVCSDFAKTGSTGYIPEGSCPWKARDLAKAYFAKTPQVTPQVKVGDLVEYCDLLDREWRVGKVSEINRSSQPYRIVGSDGGWVDWIGHSAPSPAHTPSDRPSGLSFMG
jgi:hypothetical protein